jgi:hypothetical protein
MTGRITRLGMSRWAGPGGSYRTIQRFFATVIPWGILFWVCFRHQVYCPGNVYLVAGDEVIVTKAGKCTHGLDRFFASLYGKPVKPSHCVRRGRPLPKALTGDQVQRLFAQIAHPMDRALFLVLLRCGLRVSEVAQLKLAQIDGSSPRCTSSRTKGGKIGGCICLLIWWPVATTVLPSIRATQRRAMAVRVWCSCASV